MLERILWAAVALALLMRLLHLPTASLFLILWTSALAMLYWALGWLLLPAPTRKDQLLGLSILAGFAFAALITGALFRIQVWPGADTQLTIGLVLGAATIALAMVFRAKRPDLGAYFTGLLWRAVPLVAVAALLHSVTPDAMMRFHHRGESEARIKLMQRLHAPLDEAERLRVLQALDSLDLAEGMTEHPQP